MEGKEVKGRKEFAERRGGMEGERGVFGRDVRYKERFAEREYTGKDKSGRRKKEKVMSVKTLEALEVERVGREAKKATNEDTKRKVQKGEESKEG